MALEAFRTTVAGLTRLTVEVEPVNADAEADGLVHADLRAEVESTLRVAGFEVLDRARLFAVTSDTPVLHLDVMTVRLRRQYFYSVRLELWQAVRLVRDPGVGTLAVTWCSAQTMGVVPRQSLTTIRSTIRAAVDEFIGDCRPAVGQPQAS
jgi:hypothetical protein